MNASADSLPLEIDVQSASRLLAESNDVLLLDCREQAEFDFVRIAGSTLLPMSEIAQRAGELAPHRERHIVVHCHHGGRSLEVTLWLRQQGFPRVQNMAGGIDAWAVQIDSSLPRY